MGRKAHIKKEVLMRAKKGDEKAFETIVTTYQKPIFSFIYKLVGKQPNDAEELTQDAFLKLYKSIDTYNPEKKFSSWIFTIARHTAYDNMRRTMKKKVYFSIDNPDDPFEPSDTKTSRSPQAKTIEEKIDIEQALSQVRDIYRQTLVLYYWHQYSYKQIAETLDIPLNTVKTHLRRAKEAVSEELNEPTALCTSHT